jgi:hypothetical protein
MGTSFSIIIPPSKKMWGEAVAINLPLVDISFVASSSARRSGVAC